MIDRRRIERLRVSEDFFFIYRNYVDETNKARKPCVSNPKFLIWQELPPNAFIFVGGIPIDVNMTHRRREERLRVLEESFYSAETVFMKLTKSAGGERSSKLSIKWLQAHSRLASATLVNSHHRFASWQQPSQDWCFWPKKKLQHSRIYQKHLLPVLGSWNY